MTRYTIEWRKLLHKRSVTGRGWGINENDNRTTWWAGVVSVWNEYDE